MTMETGQVNLSPADYAKAMGISKSTIWRYCREGRLPGATKFGRTYRIPKDAKPLAIGEVALASDKPDDLAPIEHEVQKTELENKLTRAKREKAQLDGEFLLNDEIRAKEMELAQREQVISEKTISLEWKEQEISNREQAVEEQEGVIAELEGREQAVAEKAETLEQESQRLDALKAEFEQVGETLKKGKRELAAQRASLKEANEHLEADTRIFRELVYDFVNAKKGKMRDEIIKRVMEKRWFHTVAIR